MQNQKHNNYTIAGLIITYMTIFLNFGVIYLLLTLGFFNQFFIIVEIPIFLILILIYIFFSLFFLIFAIAFHTNKIKSFIIIGIIDLFFFSSIGGILILIGGYIQSNKNDAKNSLNELEEKLKNLEELLEKGILSKEEYDAKRKNIIEKY